LTFEIGLVLALVVGAVVLFVSERVRSDLVALLVLVTLVLTGLLEPRDALSGFSNPAVVTVWAVFILSGGLQRSGVAGLLGRQVMRVAGRGEVRLTVAIMLVAASLSAFMNNVGVAALLLPVVMDIARRSARVILGVSEATRTAESIGPITAKKVVKAVRAVSSMVFARS